MKKFNLKTLFIALFIGLAKLEAPSLIRMDPQCPVFKCDQQGIMEGMDLCYKTDLLERNNIVYLKKCQDGKMCHGKYNRCSFDPYNVFEGKLPGQVCEYDFQCLSQVCEITDGGLTGMGICSGLVENQECKVDQQCQTGLFCDNDSKKCQKQKNIGEKCSQEIDCQNSLTCSNGLCQPYGSIKNFQLSDNKLACESGFISKDSDSQSYCVPTPQIINKQGPSYQCLHAQDTCQYQYLDKNNNLQTIDQQCQCGMNPTGASFCPNIYKPTYTKLLFEVTSKLAQNCHTSDRVNIYECLYKNIESDSDVKLLNSFIKEHFEREKNNQIRDNDQCMRRHSQVSQYWDAIFDQTVRPEFHAPTTRTSASIVRRPSFFMLMICFIIMIFFSYK